MTPPTVLGVDDSSDDLMLLAIACQTTAVSFRLLSVESGDDALAYLAGTGSYADRARFPFPRLILLDLKMPGTSGFDVLAWIRAEERFKDLPVIVFTSSVHTKDRDRALQLGASEYWVKPVGFEALQLLVRELDRALTSDGLDLSSLQMQRISDPPAGFRTASKSIG